MINPLLFGVVNKFAIEEVLKEKPKYSIGEIVDLNTWGGMKYGFEVTDIKVTYHNRLEEYVYGYMLNHPNGDSTGLTMTYIPEGYLRKRE